MTPAAAVEDSDNAADSASSLNVNEEKLKKFESFFYQILYNLSQDVSELDTLIRLYNKEQEYEKVLTPGRESQFKIEPLNYDSLLKNANLSEANLQPEYNKNSIYYTKVLFINKHTFVTLADQPYNEIKVWRLEAPAKSKSPTLIRSMKFNKPPRELKLFNNQQGVVLLERNLHLVDLNKCAHLADLNSTMNPNLPIFEIHDGNHVVILARNRLTVTLMKMPLTHEIVNENELVTTVGKTTSDDMFLFKVGEDRYLNSLQVSKNGKMMVCGDEVQKPFPLLVWDLKSRKLIYDLRIAKHEFITSIQAMSYSGKYVVCACQEEGEATNGLIVYDLTTGKLTKNLKSKANYVSVEISEELDVIVACLENSQIFVYDLTTGSKRCTFNSNRYPINKIKILTKNKSEKSQYFLTYDTIGYDWTIRLWDMCKGDQLVSSFTCPSRIISLDGNVAPYYFDEASKHTSAPNDEYYIAVSLYGSSQLLLLRLAATSSKNVKEIAYQPDDDIFSKDPNMNGFHADLKV